MRLLRRLYNLITSKTQNHTYTTMSSKKRDREDDEMLNESAERDKDTQKALRALRNLTSDEDITSEEEHVKLTLSSILGGDILGGRWFRRQFWFIIMVVGMIIIYVSNRYACQQEMIQTKMLTDTLLDRRYKALTRSSQLKERKRRSFIEESLTDTTLQTPSTPSFNLKVEE